ncbi:MAG: hypothetical protein ACR2JK_18135 [Geodermatophilaceae bacterium]
MLISATTLFAGPLAGPAGAEAGWDPLWVAIEDTSTYQDGHPTALAVDERTGRVHVTGSANPASGDLEEDFVTLSYAADGHLIRSRTFGEADDADFAADVAVDPLSGGYYVTGWTSSPDVSPRMRTAAYGRSGNVLWETSIDNFFASSVAVDATRDRVYVAGQKGYDALVVAYSRPTGQLLWSRKVVGNGLAYDGPFIDVHPGTGTVVMAWHNVGADDWNDFVTAAYSSTGRPLWNVRYDSPAAGHDMATALAVAGDGIYVLGTSYNRRKAEDDIVTLAYNLDGSRRWVANYEGPAADQDTGLDIAADPVSGTVVVTGRVQYDDAGGHLAYGGVTVAYETADGNQKWDVVSELRRGDAIAVDPSRGVVYAVATTYDPTNWATSAYDIEDGGLLREDVFSDPLGSPYTVSVDIGVDTRSGQVYVTGAFAGTVDPFVDDTYATMAYPPAR